MESRKNIFYIRHKLKLTGFQAFLVASGGRVKGTGLRINVSNLEGCSDLLLLFNWGRVRKRSKSNFTELKWTME